MSTPTDNREYLRISTNQCPHGVWMLSLDYGSGGTRYSGPKCCGRWTVMHEFLIRPEQLHEMAEEADAYAEQADRSGKAASG